MLPQLYTFVAATLALWLILMRIPKLRQKGIPAQFVFLLGLFGALLLPIYGNSASAHLFGVIGQLSVVTMLLLLDRTASHFWRRAVVSEAELQIVLGAVAVVGAGFYVLALGVSPFDPYTLGFRPALLGAILLLAGVLAYIKRKPGLLVLVAIPLLAYDMRALESPNLWDYYIDPLLVLYASVRLSQQIRSRYLRSRAA
jgi:hypothetical protein